MKRTPLSIGSTIQAKGSSSYTYIIDRVIGDGASSIVYEAHYIDSAYGRHDVRLKECYPYASDIQRIGTELVWANAETATNDKIAFTTAYHKLLNFQNTTNLRNSTAHIFDLCEANGTLYSVMDVNEGQTFEQDNSEKLSDILKTTLALARVVEKYHDNGYLHLDIKPSNFLVIPETRELVILFDVDSVTPIADIASGKVKCVSYSKGWAAPEQMQGRIDKLCPATDIYSIGAILFQKVMGRAVENEDIGIFADWDFDGEMFDMVNPKIKRLLREIFHKTIAANPKRRYQKTNNLIIALEEAIGTAEEEQYILSDCPAPSKYFVGRENELNNIRSAFASGNRAVFLSGFAGTGKSTLAKKYAFDNESSYDAILFLRYEDDLEELLESIQIQNCDECGESKIKLVRKIFNNNKVLLIVDNFDVDVDAEEYLDSLLRMKADIIFTTRTDFSDYTSNKIMQIKINSITAEQAVELFVKESNIQFSSDERVIIDEILRHYRYHTQIVPMLAAQLTASGLTLEELNKTVKHGIKAFEEAEKISIFKDERVHRKTALDMMRATFRMFKLTDLQKQVLINLYFLRSFKINKDEYRKYFYKEYNNRVKHIDAINDLIRLHWIETQSNWNNSADPYLSLHPVIVEMIESELSPNIEQSETLCAYINDYLPWSDLKGHLFEGVDDWGQLYQDTVSNKLKWFFTFVNTLELSNEVNLAYVVTNLYNAINGNIFIVELIEYWQLNKLLEKIDRHISACDADIVFMFEDICLVFEARNMIPFFGPKNAEEMRKEAQNKTYNAFFKAHAQIQKVSLDLKNTAILTLCKPILQLVEQYSRRISRDIYKVIEKYENVWYDEFGDSIWHYSELEDGDFLEDIDADFVSKGAAKNDEEIKEPNKATDGEYYYINKFKYGYDVDEIVKELKTDDRFTNSEKATIFDDMTSTIMSRVENFRLYQDNEACFKYSKFLSDTNWTRLKHVANHYLTFMRNNEFDASCDVDWDICIAERCIVVADAMLGNSAPLQEYISFVVSNTRRAIDNITVEDASEWKAWTQFWDISRLGYSQHQMLFYDTMHGTGYYANICRNLKYSYLILPLLIQCCASLEEKIEKNSISIAGLISTVYYPNEHNEDTLKYDVNDLEEPASLLYNWYRAIAEFALNSATEVFYSMSNQSDDSAKGIEYFDIFTQYCEKARALLTTTAEIQDVANNDSLDIQFFHYQYSFESISDICKEYYFRKFLRGVDITEFTAVLRSDDRLSQEDVFALCQKICDEVFFEIDRCWTAKGGLSAVREYLKTYNWKDVESLLDFQEELFLEQENDDIDADAVFACDKYRVILYSILEDKEQFDFYINDLCNDFKKKFDKNIITYHWTHFTSLEHMKTDEIIRTFNGLHDVEKESWALPYIVDVAEYVHTGLKKLSNYSESMMYEWYKMISEVALDVIDDDGIYLKYQNMVDEMADKHYELSDSAFDQ